MVGVSALESEKSSLTGQIETLQGQVSDAESTMEAINAELAEKVAKATTLESQLSGQLVEAKAALDAATSNAAEQEQLARKMAEKIALVQREQAKGQADASAVSSLASEIAGKLESIGVADAVVAVREDGTIGINLKSEALFNSGQATLSERGQTVMGRVGTALNDFKGIRYVLKDTQIRFQCRVH